MHLGSGFWHLGSRIEDFQILHVQTLDHIHPELQRALCLNVKIAQALVASPGACDTENMKALQEAAPAVLSFLRLNYDLDIDKTLPTLRRGDMGLSVRREVGTSRSREVESSRRCRDAAAPVDWLLALLRQHAPALQDSCQVRQLRPTGFSEEEAARHTPKKKQKCIFQII